MIELETYNMAGGCSYSCLRHKFSSEIYIGDTCPLTTCCSLEPAEWEIPFGIWIPDEHLTVKNDPVSNVEGIM